jgi:hypothetical protein
MNTPKTGMRTLLAAVAAGALVLGSAAGVSAAPGKGKGPKAPKPQLQVVNIKGHSPVNVFDVATDDGNGMSLRALTLRATVRDKAKAVEGDATVKVMLDAFNKKVAGTELTGFEPIEVILTPKSTKSKVNKHYEATLAFTTDQAAALKALLTQDSTPYLCIADADVVGYDNETQSKQTQKRLGNRGKAVRDCVKIVAVDPTTTKTTKDDPAPVAPVAPAVS